MRIKSQQRFSSQQWWGEKPSLRRPERKLWVRQTWLVCQLSPHRDDIKSLTLIDKGGSGGSTTCGLSNRKLPGLTSLLTGWGALCMLHRGCHHSRGIESAKKNMKKMIGWYYYFYVFAFGGENGFCLHFISVNICINHALNLRSLSSIFRKE